MSSGVPILLCLLCVASSCNRPSVLVDIKRPESEEDRNQIRKSPIILVGVITEDTPAAPVVTGRFWNTLLQLHVLDLEVEKVLQGNIATRRARIYYYQLAGASDGNRPLGLWHDGSGRPEPRRLFFVREDSGTLRLACDGIDTCTMAVDSGVPRFVSSADALEKKIADVLLTPGVEVNVLQFCEHIPMNLGKVDKSYIQPKLIELIHNVDPAIRDCSCEDADEHLGRAVVLKQTVCQGYLARIKDKKSKF